MNTTKNIQKTEFTVMHEFNAPRQLVFDSFRSPEALNEWWGPVECNNTVVKLDFRPGGIFHFKMDYSGNISYGRFLFGKIESPELLEFSNAFADENANVVKPPFDFDFPYEIFYRLVFTEKNGKTVINLTGRPMNASEKEMKGYLSIFDDMERGFGATFNKLVEYLGKKDGK